MDLIIKIILSTTLIVVIKLTSKVFTSNNFDKIFMPKSQKLIHSVFFILLISLIFIGYGVVFSAMYSSFIEYKYSGYVILLLFIMYIISLLSIATLVLYKWKKDKRNIYSFEISKKKSEHLIFFAVFINMCMYSIFLHSIFSEHLNKNEIIVEVLRCTIFFISIAYGLMKASLFLQGINKKKWGYVLSPTPEDINQRHLHILYSLNQSTLVLSEDPDDNIYPRSVYLFDITNGKYIFFNRVLNIKKEENNKHKK
ncbi:hypothetical protein M3223_12155 [Paenibacillus pasadenensis]|uniref:hypothetical protein n=1 Tax=Paenibacillus pasadenensis TaxID=217090 RepID=UPI00203D18C2|nr:hypothetical protein [Paenibacillus pasadenensis]MCM3748106.1 hypothetical protein [Paenibacillus pasadenensis]